jgi:hypothetical protein
MVGREQIMIRWQAVDIDVILYSLDRCLSSLQRRRVMGGTEMQAHSFHIR